MTKDSGSKKRKNFQITDERRKAPRLDAESIPFLIGAYQVGGPEVKLINISRGGALIESREPLAKGSEICLQLVTAGKVYLIRGRILRYYISFIAGNALRYRSAIAFDKDLAIMPTMETSRGVPSEMAESADDSARAAVNSELSGGMDETPIVLTINTSDFCSENELRQIFETDPPA